MEIVITVGVFAVLASGVILLVADPLASGVHGSQRNMAANLVQQGVEGSRAIKDAAWTNLTLGVHGVTRDVSGNWLFTGVSDTTVVGGVNYVRTATVTTACRDAGGTLTLSCGTIDPRTKLVTVTVAWTSGVTAIPRTVSQAIYFSDWETYDWTQTTDTDFGGGLTKTNITVSGTGTAGNFTLAASNKAWTSLGAGSNIVHTTDTDWGTGSSTTTAITGVGVPASVTELGALAWTNYTQPLTWTETLDTEFVDGNFATSTSAVADTGNLGAVVLNNNLTDSATMTSPTTRQLNSISCFSTSNCWSVGDNSATANSLATIIQWNGTSWANVNTPAWAGGAVGWGLNGVAVTSATEAYAVGDLQDLAGAIIRYNGASWVASASTTRINQNFRSIAMLNPSFGWIGADAGQIMKWNGVSWVAFVDTGAQNFTGMAVNSATDAWAVTGTGAQAGQFWHFNGTAWSQLVDKGAMVFSSITCVNSNLCWATDDAAHIWKYNGNFVAAGWQSFFTAAGNLNNVTCISSTSCFAVGAAGRIYQFNGTTWSLITTTSLQPIGGVTLLGANEVSTSKAFFVGSGGTIVEYAQHFQQNGIYYSSVYDATSTQTWSTISWDEYGTTQQNGIDLTIATRSGPSACAGLVNCPGWSTWSAEQTLPAGGAITSPINRYFQYRVTMVSQVRNTTPRLNSIVVTYNVPLTGDYYGMYMGADNDGWAFSYPNGYIAHWDGAGWSSYPSPTTNWLDGAAGSGVNDVWGVGVNGAIVHWNGTAWSNVTSSTTGTFYDADCLSSTLCRAVGAGGLMDKWNGAVWALDTSNTTENLESVWHVTTTDVWAAGTNGKIMHYNGTAWSEFVDTGAETWHGMQMLSATDGWVVGTGGAIRRWNGTAWNTVTSPTANGLQDLYCVNASDCWAQGDVGTIVHWNGTAWSLYASSPTVQDVETIFMNSSTHGWSVAHGTTFLEYRYVYPPVAYWDSPIIDGGATSTVWNSIAWDDVLPATTNITIATRSGPNPTCCTGWSAYSAELTTPGGSIITSPNNRYFQYRVTFTSGNTVNTGELQEVRITRDAITTQNLNGVKGTGISDVWVVGDSGVIIHYNGSSWSSFSSPTSANLNDIDALTTSNAQAVGATGKIAKYNGTLWSLLTSPTVEDLYGIDLRTASDGWAVGTNGAIIRWNGVSWTSATTTPTANALYDVSASSSAGTDGHAVGAAGTTIRWNGTTWSTVTSGTANALNGVACWDASHCWAVGDNGTIRFWNGSAWSGVTSPVVTRLNAVDWRSLTEAWAIGDFGTILKYDGVSWVNYTSPTTRNLYALTAGAETNGWIGGVGGELDKDPVTYQPSGVFESSVVDMDAATSTPMTAYWSASSSAQTTVLVTMRVGNTATPDGTWSGFAPNFTSSTGSPISLGSARYAQYKVYLSTSDTDVTPTFNDITVTYR